MNQKQSWTLVKRKLGINRIIYELECDLNYETQNMSLKKVQIRLSMEEYTQINSPSTQPTWL